MLRRLNAHISNHIVSRDEIKKTFAQVIKDQSIPLDERWEFFTSAPCELKTHKCWLEYFDSIDVDDFLAKWYERHETINTRQIYERLRDSGKFDANRLDEFREEVLSRNLGSFEFDW